MRTWAACLLLVGSLPGCASVSRTSNTSGNSSGQSANSSGASGATSQNSSASSAQSSDGSRNSATSVQSSLDSTNASSGSSGASSSIVAGSALLLGAAGGIITTVYTVKNRREARLQREQLRQLQQAPPPPTPLQPTAPTPPAPHSRRLEEEPTLDAMVLARAWLMANRLQLAQDLALGAGPAVDDLAWISGITPAHRAHFGQVLQRHRERLLVGEDVTPKQAAEVMSRVGELVMGDPVLRVDGGAVLAAW